jgi:hypothetical protein
MILDVPARFSKRAHVTVVSLDENNTRVETQADGDPVSGVPVLAQHGDESWTLIFDFYGVAHYFHFMETFIWVYIIQQAGFAGLPMQRVIFTTRHWDAPHQNHVQSKLLALFYPGVEIVDRGDARLLDVSNLVHLDRSICKTKINKFLEQALPYGRRWVMQMCQHVRDATGCVVTPRAGRRLRALYVKRQPPRCLASDYERQLLALLGTVFDVRVADFAALDWEDQVRAAASADLMVGVHGNGLTNLLWLQPGSVVIELFPPGFRQYDYQVMCELSGISYFGIEGELVHREYGRDGPCRGTGLEGNVTIEALDWPAVNDVLGGVRSLLNMLV